MNQQTLVLLYPGCIEYEIMLAAELLHPHFPLLMVTPEGETHQGSSGFVFQPQTAYRNVCLEAIQVVLVPGGDPGSVVDNADLMALLSAIGERQILLGAICAGPLLPAKAGLLKGKRFTHGYGETNQAFLAPFWKGAQFIDKPVVVDQTIVTAQPQAHIDFGVTLLALTGHCKPDKAERLKAYYKGQIT